MNNEINQELNHSKKNSLTEVSIIILNWNGWMDTIECLESLYQIDYPNYEVIILDNNSNDDSIGKIRDYCSGKLKIESNFFKYVPENKPIKIFEITESKSTNIANISELLKLPSNKKLILIKNDKNYGFAEGNNIGIRFALKNLDSAYVLLLNNDTVVSPDFLDILIRSIEKEDEIGIIGSKINFYQRQDTVQTLGWNINWNKGKCYPPKDSSIKLIDVDSVGGCSILINTNLIKELGDWNAEYFAYWEDVEFCYRARKAGYKVVCNPKSIVWHKGSVSAGKITGFNLFYNTRNRFWFMKKHATKNQYTKFKLYFFLYEVWYTTLYLVISNKLNELYCYFSGIMDGLKLNDFFN